MPNFSFNPDLRFENKTSNFADTLYRIKDPTSRIHRLLYSLLEIGIGQAKGTQDLALIAQSSLATTTGQELDQYFAMFGIRRMKEYGDGLTLNAIGNDARFRIAIAKFLQALSLGGTAAGLRLMAEASTTFKCNIVEPWRNYDIDFIRDNARLLNADNNPTGNEIIIFVYPNVVLDEDEINQLRVRTITNCKIIAPLHTSLTVVVVPTAEDTKISPSYVSSGSFSYITEASSVNLLSQEAEISLNDSVTDIKIYELGSEFVNIVGSLDAAIDDNDTTIRINETVAPNAPIFFIKLQQGATEEIVQVLSRTFVEYNEANTVNVFDYTIARAQHSTTAASFTSATIYSDATPVFSQSRTVETFFEDWQPIPLADSYDNYPSGKYPNDPNRYDAQNNYLFEWASQNEFYNWFQNYITQLGGEVVNGRYRMSVTQTSSSDSNQDDSLINQIMGSSYNFLRPIPGVN